MLPRVLSRKFYLLTAGCAVIFVLTLQVLDISFGPRLQWKSHADHSAALRCDPLPLAPPPVAARSCPDVPQERMSSRASFDHHSKKDETEILRHAPGFTVYDRLYLFDGTFYIVTADVRAVPPIHHMISNGVKLSDTTAEERMPSAKHMQVISPEEASKLFGKYVTRIKGVSFATSDPWNYMPHYYHFVAEQLYATWRAYTSLDPEITTTGETTLPPPARYMLFNSPSDKWIDPPRLNEYIFRSIFPSAAMEYQDEWLFREATKAPFVFDRVLLTDRSASGYFSGHDHSMMFAAPAFSLPGNANWWLPVRSSLLESVGMDKETGMGVKHTPVITYVSRQASSGRRLEPRDHETLVRALNKLKAEKGYEVNVVRMELLTEAEQIRLSARSTIIMGVHGNGLTAHIWMYPTPRSALFEFFYPEGFSYHYEWPSKRLGIPHYGFWGSKYFTPKNAPTDWNVVENFHSRSIPVDGDLVASLADKILSGEM